MLGLTIDLNTVSVMSITDSIFELAPYISSFVPFSSIPAGANNLGGLARTLHFLKARQDTMMDGGISDPSGSPSIGNAYGANFSLAGLTKRIEIEEKREIRATAMVMSMVDTVNNTDTIKVRNLNNAGFEITAYRDFAPLL